MRKEDKLVSREELYEMVWKTPMVKLAKEFGLSDVALAKTCRRHNVPRPPRGYWTKLDAGKKVERIPLPREKDDMKIRLVYHEHVDTSHSEKPDISHLLVDVMPIIEYERQPENRVEVPEMLESTNRLIRHTRAVLRSGRPDKYNRVSGSPPDCLDISVFKSGIDRACCLMHALVERLKHHRIVIDTSTEYPNRSSMIILDERVDFSLKQRSKQILHVLTPEDEREMKRRSFFEPDKYDYLPRDEMTLKITNVPWRFTGHVIQEYRDTSKLRIEQRLNEFIISAVSVAALMKEDRKLKAKENELRAEERRKSLEQQRKQAIEEARQKQLGEQASAWHQAEKIRQYVAAVREYTPLETDYDIEEWATWALEHADALDPILKGHPWTEEVGIDEWRYRD